MKILCLVLASTNTPFYQGFLEQWRRFAHSNSSITTVFLIADEILETETKREDDVLYIKGPETFEFVSIKMFKALKAFYSEFDSYDFILRPNLSSFIYFPKYLEYCKKFQPTRFCSAVVGYEQFGLFPSGSAFTVTPDVAKLLVDEYPKFEKLGFMDDVLIGYILRQNEIKIYSMPRFWVDELLTQLECEQIKKDNFHFHFRIRTANREQDVKTMKICIDTYYGA
jgi:hypothetical protein